MSVLKKKNKSRESEVLNLEILYHSLVLVSITSSMLEKILEFMEFWAKHLWG
jgi:hypothetical protein